ncbi:membrane protein involved in the export of O-antigen and teichoic acid [Cryptobacterium curtum DSM 15641]|uniref:Membrane protein involved in the export of O-antigen and teichoic acid n=1 Tax=Cryptobacterium curtum (strain ATCC 700683 / DSM 15641 / CCUG 43107 / 12-3) TaxID=469378 RepID=C7MM36_CRYCD|nr:lipopolysaccharide biosynthesis protein [Cryptobacterium curtum]ACU93976.1 membrane protein involved in the export of O-antigen and teichoic acid [Cryptobacterium curtum DSM 15641]
MPNTSDTSRSRRSVRAIRKAAQKRETTRSDDVQIDKTTRDASRGKTTRESSRKQRMIRSGKVRRSKTIQSKTSRSDDEQNGKYASDRFIGSAARYLNEERLANQASYGYFKSSREIEDEQGHRARRQPGRLRKLISDWGDRLLGAVSDKTFSGQEELYDGGRTKLDYVWNTAGLTTWGMVFPLLTIVVTQLSGVEAAGMFSFAFVAGTLLMILANYGARTFQVSDLKEAHSFRDYQINRWITCLLMLLVGWAFCTVRGYDGEMLLMTTCVFIYKMIDGLADVYEGRLQQKDKLYLAGVSQAVRSVAVFILFTLALLITRSIGVAAMVMAVVAVLSFLLVTLPLTLFETPRSGKLSLSGVADLFKQCFPMFIALFLYALVDNMPKFVMEGTLTYDNQLYFSALYFPAQAILLSVGFIYKPLLVRMAEAWVDPDRRSRFDLFIIAFIGIIVGITLFMEFMMSWIGIPIMSVLYGVDFEGFRNLATLMIAAGGITAGIDFLYQVVTVMRHQKSVTQIYLVTFVFSLFIPWMLIHVSGLSGAVIGYLIVMAMLFVMLLMDYVSVRLLYRRHPEDDPAYAELQAAVEARRRTSSRG